MAEEDAYVRAGARPLRNAPQIRGAGYDTKQQMSAAELEKKSIDLQRERARIAIGERETELQDPGAIQRRSAQPLPPEARLQGFERNLDLRPLPAPRRERCLVRNPGSAE